MRYIDGLLAVARRYAEIEGVKLSTVSSRAFNDGKKLRVMEDGDASITVDRCERAMQWFSDNWPAGEWPADVPRPAPAHEPLEARA